MADSQQQNIKGSNGSIIGSELPSIPPGYVGTWGGHGYIITKKVDPCQDWTAGYLG